MSAAWSGEQKRKNRQNSRVKRDNRSEAEIAGLTKIKNASKQPKAARREAERINGGRRIRAILLPSFFCLNSGETRFILYEQLIEITAARSELIALDAHLLEQGDEEVAERGLLAALFREKEMSPVFEAAAGGGSRE